MTRRDDIVRFGLAAALTILMALCLALPAWSSPSKAPERVNAVFIGDRLVDVAFNLGFVPEGTALRCSLWPMCQSLKSATQVLGCPNRILNNPGIVPGFLKERGIRRVIIERTPAFCLYKPDADPVKAAKLLEGMDVQIQYVDFSKGVPAAIRETAELLGVPKRGEELAASYAEDFARAKASIPATALGKRVVVLSGTLQESTGKAFLRVELPGGYTDQYILGPLGCDNVGDELFDKAPTMSKGHAALRSLKRLAQAKPDAIVMTGHSLAVQLAIQGALEKHPELADVPALSRMAVYALPFYADSSVIEYPSIFTRWLRALR